MMVVHAHPGTRLEYVSVNISTTIENTVKLEFEEKSTACMQSDLSLNQTGASYKSNVECVHSQYTTRSS
jgi:hypothetical protein